MNGMTEQGINTNYTKGTKRNYTKLSQKMQSNYNEIQIYKETQNNHKKIQNNYKEMHNNHR